MPERNRNPHEKVACGGFVHSLNIVIYPIALYHAILDITSVFFFNSIITKLLDNNIRTYKNEKTIGLKLKNLSD